MENYPKLQSTQGKKEQHAPEYGKTHRGWVEQREGERERGKEKKEKDVIFFQF